MDDQLVPPPPLRNPKGSEGQRGNLLMAKVKYKKSQEEPERQSRHSRAFEIQQSLRCL